MSSSNASDGWEIIDLNQLRRQFSGKPVEYREFLRVPTMSCGLYRLEAGSKDMQGPHDEDEVYFVLEGRASIRVSGERRTVKPGDLLYIRASEEHSFFEIEEPMTLLVFFATAPANH